MTRRIKSSAAAVAFCLLIACALGLGMALIERERSAGKLLELGPTAAQAVSAALERAHARLEEAAAAGFAVDAAAQSAGGALAAAVAALRDGQAGRSERAAPPLVIIEGAALVDDRRGALALRVSRTLGAVVDPAREAAFREETARAVARLSRGDGPVGAVFVDAADAAGLWLTVSADPFSSADAPAAPKRLLMARLRFADPEQAAQALGASGPLRLRAEAENGPGGGADGALRVWARIGADGLVVSAEKLSAPERGWAAILLAAALALGASLAFVAHARLARSDARELTDLHESALDDIRAAEANLRASEERFRRLAESTNVIPWSADLDRQRFAYVGPQIEALSGYSAESWRAPGFWTQHIHPADRRRVLSEVVEMSASAGYRTLEYRIRAGNSGVLHVRNMLTVFTENGPKGPRNVAQGFLLDVTEAKIAAAALELARRKAEDANRVKSEFLANMSHELRTPLNAIIGFSEIMKDQVFGPLDDRYQEYAANVHKSGRHLLDLINDILDLSKIEAGRVEIVEEPTDVFELLDECRMLLEEQVQTAGLTCSVTVAQNTPRLSIDMRRIKQVLLNLMSNAIKFTEPGGGLRLSAEIAPAGGVVIAVADDGIGMSPDEIPRALAKFGQIDGELTRKHDGSGLGLPIAKSLIELHGGVFELRSTKGVGTEVRLHLPASRICAEAA